MSRNLLSTRSKMTALAVASMLAVTVAAPAHAVHKLAASPERVIDFKSCALPQYPAADLKAEHEGKVTLEFKVDPQGAIMASKVVKSSGFPGLDEEARSAIAKCKFTPAKAGARSARWEPVQYVWKLK